jgi:hypothetical protein
MKKLIYVLVFGLLSSFAIVSCEKDDNDSNMDSYYEYDGQKYELSQGFYEIYEDELEGNEIFLMLISDDFKVDFLNEELEGKGNIVELTMFSKNSTSFTTREYLPYSIEDMESLENFWYVGFFGNSVELNDNTSEDDFNYLLSTTNPSSSVFVESDASDYKINFSGKDFEGKDFKLSFKGKLTKLEVPK